MATTFFLTGILHWIPRNYKMYISIALTR